MAGRRLARLVLLAGLALPHRGGLAAECSTSCSNEFTGGCINAKSGTEQEKYDLCRQELCNSRVPIANTCDDPSCTDTDAMAALNARGSFTCDTSGGGSGPPTPGSGGGGGGGGDAPVMCDASVTITGQPASPTLCTPSSEAVSVYTFWDGSAVGQRYFSVFNLAGGSSPKPVLIQVNGYSGDSKISADGEDAAAATYYGFALMKITSALDDGNGGFSLEFGNNGIANDANPTPCSADDSRDIVYLRAVFDWIAAQSAQLDAARVFTRGFSQNSMFAAYTAVCFADKVAGVWQGGSGLARTGYTPIVPGAQAQCSLTAMQAAGSMESCCQQSFCSECKYWPLYPQTCAATQPANKLVDCLMAYTDDGIACGTDKYMFDAMVREGNDARLLSFAPATGVRGGHDDPENAWAWVSGCLGLAEACSSACEASFATCAGSTVSPTRFAECETDLKAGTLSGCTVGCAPTLAMLQKSETPVVTLSEGKFGRSSGVATASTTAPDPACTNDVGSFATVAHNQCQPPSSVVLPDAATWPEAGTSSVCTGTAASGSNAGNTSGGTTPGASGSNAGNTGGGTSPGASGPGGTDADSAALSLHGATSWGSGVTAAVTVLVAFVRC